MRLFLIRHPQPIIAKGLCYGRTDLDVTDDEVKQVAERLISNLPRKAALYSSTLPRCAKLAQFLAYQIPTPKFDARLVEMDFGLWEMQAWDAIERAEIDAWAANPIHYSVGGGETVLQMAQRVSDFYADLLRWHQHELNEVIVICHAGTIRMLQACALANNAEQVALSAAATTESVDYGNYVIVNISNNMKTD